MKLRIVPGNDVDSLIIKVGPVIFSAIVLQADSMKDKSGFLSLVSGVGTAITTTSEPAISAPVVLAR
jgi:hypothetical protein